MTINCGYLTGDTAFPVTWIINGTSFDQQEIMNSPLYQQNRQSTPTENSLTVFSINVTTTFQCVVLSTTNRISTIGTVTVTGMYVHTYVCMYILVCVLHVAWIRGGGCNFTLVRQKYKQHVKHLN